MICIGEDDEAINVEQDQKGHLILQDSHFECIDTEDFKQKPIYMSSVDEEKTQ